MIWVRWLTPTCVQISDGSFPGMTAVRAEVVIYSPIVRRVRVCASDSSYHLKHLYNRPLRELVGFTKMYHKNCLPERYIIVSYIFCNTFLHILASCNERFDPSFGAQCDNGDWQLRAFYNSTIQMCEIFWYDKCDGHGNNIFADLKVCNICFALCHCYAN